ncbi:MAG: NADPH-dependent FMN reductase [Chloroflexia bacterium]
MTNTIHVLGFSGSLRKASFNTGLLNEASKLLPDGMTLETFDLSPIPFYNADVEAEGAPDAVRHFKDRIAAAANALLIATPEYNYSVTGVLKNAIDWVSRPPKDSPFVGKPVTIMGAGGLYGTVRAQLHLRQILLATGSNVMTRPDVHVMRSWEKFDSEGNLTDEETREQVAKLMVALRDWIRQLKNEA